MYQPYFRRLCLSRMILVEVETPRRQERQDLLKKAAMGIPLNFCLLI
jgi:hypothetical protein